VPRRELNPLCEFAYVHTVYKCTAHPCVSQYPNLEPITEVHGEGQSIGLQPSRLEFLRSFREVEALVAHAAQC
jgi:hypothetical protein